MEAELISSLLKILLLAFIQNISFTIVSRSRNRGNKRYHMIAALFSNSIWFLTFRELIKGDMNLVLFMPYVMGTIAGSTYGMMISMQIEKWLGASADGHLEKDEDAEPSLIQKWEAKLLETKLLKASRKLFAR